MTTRVAEENRGKELVYRTNRVGTVTDVAGDDVFVDPDFEVIPDDLRGAFGWDQTDDRYAFDQQMVTDISNGTGRLRDDVLRA